MYSLIETCKLCGIEPYAYVKDILTRLSTLPASRLHELLPRNWRPPLVDDRIATLQVLVSPASQEAKDQ